MILLGIVTDNSIINNQIKVRIPSFEGAGNNQEYECSCNVGIQPGVNPNYKVNDVVYISFVGKGITNKFVIGKLFTSGEESIGGKISGDSLNIITQASLPEATTIGKVSGKDIRLALEEIETINRKITILSEHSGGGGEPAQYLKNASVNGGTLTLTKKDDSTVTFTPVSFNPMKTSSTVEADDWTGEHFNTTTLQASQKILNDSTTSDGQCYLATVHWTDLPTSSSGQTITQIEVRAYVIKKSAGIVLFEANSADRAPYNWTYNSYSSGRVWIPLGGNSVSISTTTPSTTNVARGITVDGTIYKFEGSGGSVLDTNVSLSDELNVYTPVGLITEASPTNPVKVGDAGDSIRQVFQKMFVGDDENPLVTIPTISVAKKDNNFGQTYPIVLGEEIYPKFIVTYANVDGSYQYGSTIDKTSTVTGMQVDSSTFKAGEITGITGTITNVNRTQELQGSLKVVRNNNSITVGGVLNFDRTNLRIARTKLGVMATTAKSGSTGTLGSDGKISNTSITLNDTSFNVAPTGTYTSTKPTCSILLTNEPSGTQEVGKKYTISATLNHFNFTGYYLYGYVKDGERYTGRQEAGGTLSSLLFKYGSEIIASSTSAIGTIIEKEVQIVNVGNNSGSFTGTLGYTFPTDRYPLSRNQNEIDTTIIGADYRIGGNTGSYTPSTASASWSCTGYRRFFYGYVTAQQLASLDASVIRSLTSPNSAVSAQTLPTLAEDTSKKAIIIAIINSSPINVTKVTMPSSSEADVTSNFVKQSSTIDVPGLESYSPVPYKYWIYNPATMGGTYKIVLG